MNIKFEVYYNSAWIDVSTMVDNGQNWTMTLDSSMDYGTFTMNALDPTIDYPMPSQTRWPSNLPLRLTLTGASGSIVEYFLANDTVRYNGRLAYHSVRLKEPTTLLENYFICGIASSDTISNGVSIPKTQQENLERILRVGITHKVDTPQLFTLDPSLETRLSGIIAPNYRFNYRQSLRDILFNIAWDFEAIPRLLWSTTTNSFSVVTFDFYNEIRTGETDYYTASGVKETYEIDLDETEYCQGLFNPVANMITQSGIGALTYVPSQQGYLAPVCDTIQYEDTTAYVPTYKRIYRISSLKCGFIASITLSGETTNYFIPDIDISNYIIDKREWDLLSAKSVTSYDPTAQACWLYYEIGGMSIENAFTPNKIFNLAPWSNPIAFIIEDVLWKSTTPTTLPGYVLNSDYSFSSTTPVDVLVSQLRSAIPTNGQGYFFNIGGQFYIDAPCSSYKPTFTANTGDVGLQIPYNQSDDLLSSLSLGNNQFNQVKKTGNEVQTITYKISDVTQIPACGHMFADGTRVSCLEFTFTSNDLVQLTVTVCQNEIARSNQVRLDRKYRNWNIPDEQVTRYLSYNDYCKLTLSNTTDFVPQMNGFSNTSFNPFYTIANGAGIIDTIALFITNLESSNEGNSLGLDKKRFGKSISLDCSMQTPTVVGMQNPDYMNSGTRFIQDVTQAANGAYAVIFYGNGKFTSPKEAMEYPEGLTTDIIDYTGAFYADKDVAEVIAWHHQIHFVSSTLVIGDMFVELQQLLSNTSSALTGYTIAAEAYSTPKQNFAVYDGTNKLGDLTLTNTANYTTVNLGTQAVADACKSWAIYIVMNNVKYFMVGTNAPLAGTLNQTIQITL